MSPPTVIPPVTKTFPFFNAAIPKKGIIKGNDAAVDTEFVLGSKISDTDKTETQPIMVEFFHS